MSDAAIRQEERDGAGLLARYRAGLLEVAYPCAPDVDCTFGPKSGRSHGEDCECGDSWRVPVDPEDLLRLLAFLGVEEARALCSEGDAAKWATYDTADLDLWLDMLSRLLAKLPARRVEEKACSECDSTGEWEIQGDPWEPGDEWPEPVAVKCEACSGSARYKTDTPAERWLLVAACVTVGREILRSGRGLAPGEGDPGARRAEEAIAAAEAWVEEPTNAGEEAWGRSGEVPAWCPMPFPAIPTRRLQAAAKILSTERVREIASNSLLKVL